jgi:hypothetical protein
MNGPEIEHIVSIVIAEVDRQFEPIFAETEAMQRRLQELMTRIELTIARIDANKNKAND